jgi:malate synthase
MYFRKWIISETVSPTDIKQGIDLAVSYAREEVPLGIVLDWIEEHISDRCSQLIKQTVALITGIKPITMWGGEIPNDNMLYATIQPTVNQFNQLNDDTYEDIRTNAGIDVPANNFRTYALLVNDEIHERIISIETAKILTHYIDIILEKIEDIPEFREVTQNIHYYLQDMKQNWKERAEHLHGRDIGGSIHFELRERFHKLIKPWLRRLQQEGIEIPPEFSIFWFFWPIVLE